MQIPTQIFYMYSVCMCRCVTPAILPLEYRSCVTMNDFGHTWMRRSIYKWVVSHIYCVCMCAMTSKKKSCCLLQCVSVCAYLSLMWAMTHSDVCHDVFICLSWLRKPKTVLWMAMCEFVCMSHSEVSSCTYLILMWAITHLDTCRDSFIRVSWLKSKIGAVGGNMWACVDISFGREFVCVSDIDVGHDSFWVRAVTCLYVCQLWRIYVYIHQSHNSREQTGTVLGTVIVSSCACSILMWDMTPSDVCCNSFMWVWWLF